MMRLASNTKVSTMGKQAVKQSKEMSQGVDTRKLERSIKRAAQAKFKRITKQNTMIDAKGDTAQDGRTAKKQSNQRWENRESNTVDYRLWKPRHAKPSAVAVLAS